MARKYYWLKLHRDFFKRHDIMIVESMPNGKDYVLFYLKLLVESIEHEGRLRFSDTIPYDELMLATITHTDVDVVRSALKIFEKLGLIELLSDDTLYLKAIEKMVGKETDAAKRMRKMRENKKSVTLLQDVQKSYTELESEIELEKEKTLSKAKEQQKETREKRASTAGDSHPPTPTANAVASQVIDYLNNKTHRAFRASSAKTKRVVGARMREGYTVEDFRRVIDHKASEWMEDEKMREYLRPETLFGTKFEGYLQAAPKEKAKWKTCEYGHRYAVYEPFCPQCMAEGLL